MNEHLYKLEPYKGMKTRYSCPSCQQHKVFSLYINTETGEHLNETVGRCNRESNCSYHYTPKQYFEENNISFDKPQQHRQQRVIQPPQPKPISFVSVEVFTASLQSHESNNFIKYLIDLFGVEVTKALIEKYFIGTSNHWNGATVFWQIDKDYQVRTGKIMLYSPITGKRVKEPFNHHINWVHTALKLPDFELKQCLFGEHLLDNNTKPLAIVESEKTAIIASVYLPHFNWLATGGLDNFTAEKCKVLQGRTVFLYPDLSKPKPNKLSTFEKWSNKAKEFSTIANFVVSDLLERTASDEERKQGLDLADYLIRFNYKDFIEPEPPAPPPPADEVVRNETKHNEYNDLKERAKHNEYNDLKERAKHNEYNDLKEGVLDWSKEVEELEAYFKSITLPKVPILFKEGEKILNVERFLESHLATLKQMNGKKCFLSHLHRLRKLKDYLAT
jgi:hypothetical protein